MIDSPRRYFDPLYGPTVLTEFEASLVDLPEIQRLREIRLCNINSLFITGASEISRFEHTIGILRLAQEWTRSRTLDPRTAKLIICAAVLHDSRTGPFGHSFQYVLEDNIREFAGEFKHDDLSHGALQSYYQKTDAGATYSGIPFSGKTLLGENWNEVDQFIKGQGHYGRLISGDMDLDNIDNVIRLAYHTGVADRSDAQVAIRLARDIEPTQSGLLVSDDLIPLIKRWQQIRQRLYELLLLDWGDFSAKAMLTRALEIAVQHKLLGVDSWRLTDEQLLKRLETESVGEAQEVGELIRRIRTGHLFHPLVLFSSDSVKVYQKFSDYKFKTNFESNIDHIVNKYTAERTNYLLHTILDSKKTHRSVLVNLRRSGETLRVGRDSEYLLIGIFGSRTTVRMQKRAALLAEIQHLLETEGCFGLSEIPDPVQSNVEDRNSRYFQTSLL